MFAMAPQLEVSSGFDDPMSRTDAFLAVWNAAFRSGKGVMEELIRSNQQVEEAITSYCRKSLIAGDLLPSQYIEDLLLTFDLREIRHRLALIFLTEKDKLNFSEILINQQNVVLHCRRYFEAVSKRAEREAHRDEISGSHYYDLSDDLISEVIEEARNTSVKLSELARRVDELGVGG